MINDSTSQPYTILRIKRKRNEEPLDALVVESSARRKKTRQDGIFQFAQTVDTKDWNVERQKSLQHMINDLSHQQLPPASPPKVQHQPQVKRTYTVVPTEEEKEAQKRRHRPTQPPKVLSTKDLPPPSEDFTMFDAVLNSEEEHKKEDEEMAKFMPMLQDYLRLHDINPADSVPPSTIHSRSTSSDEYVWDIFYHRPTTVDEWNAISTNVATLTGLPPSLDNPYDSDTSEEYEDEADEDSNDENWYTNDYPEGEESDSESDIFDDDLGGADDDDDEGFADKFSGWR